MREVNVQQGSQEWLQARVGIITASELSNLLTPAKLEISEGAAVESYLAYKLAERWRGEPLPSFSGGNMEQGTILEPELLSSFEFDTGLTIRKVGFCLTDDGSMGCSPDGLLDPDEGCEVKNPLPQTHVSYLLAGTLPRQYGPQCHGCLYVTGRKQWRFVSARRGFPRFEVIVKRDEKIMATIHKAVTTFNKRLNDAYARLVDLNGGEPVREVVETRTLAGYEDELSPDRAAGFQEFLQG